MSTSLVRIRAAIDDMPDTLSRIGKYVLDNPEKVLRSSLDEVAEFAQSGQASVIRFCRALGYAGFPDFKLNLAADLARGAEPELQGLSDGDRFGRLAVRVGASVTATARGIDAESLLALARRVKAARRVEIYGAGISGSVAGLLGYRLLRLGIPAQAYPDAVTAHEVMVGLDGHCVAIGVSETGVTPATVQFLQAARVAGSYTVAITARAASPLARRADLALFTVPVDPPPTAGEVTATFAKIFLIEALAGVIAKL